MENLDFEELAEKYGELKEYLPMDFSDRKALLCLNKAILAVEYKIDYYDVPEGYLLPRIPQRAEYLDRLSELFPEKTEPLHGFDIGFGANFIYPLLATKHNWKMSGSDINPQALDSAQNLIEKNNLTHIVSLKLQPDPSKILDGVLD